VDIISIVLNKFSIFGFILAAMIANLFPGIPEEIFLLTIGYFGATSGFGPGGLLGTALFLVAGFLVIDTGIYYLSMKGNKYAKKLAALLLGKDFDMHSPYVQKHIPKIVFVSRFLVNIRFIGPFLAGSSKYSFRKFIQIDILALLIYVPMMLWLGGYFESRISQITSGVGVVRNIFGFTIVFIVVAIAARKGYEMFKRKLEQKESI